MDRQNNELIELIAMWEKVSDVYSGLRVDTWNIKGNYIANINGHDNPLKLKLVDLLHDDITVIEFGCGTGKLLLHMARSVKSGTFIGIDISRKMATEAAKTMNAIKSHKLKVAIVASAFETCPLPNNIGDIVVAKMVIHHLPKPIMAFKQAGRIIRPGGHMLIMVPGKLYQAELFPPYEYNDLLGRLSIKELNNLALSAQLQVNDVHSHKFEHTFANLFDYLMFMNSIGATSKMLGYTPSDSIIEFLNIYQHVLKRTSHLTVQGEYITLDCIKDFS